jgi:hypothetical protein
MQKPAMSLVPAHKLSVNRYRNKGLRNTQPHPLLCLLFPTSPASVLHVWLHHDVRVCVKRNKAKLLIAIECESGKTKRNICTCVLQDEKAKCMCEKKGRPGILDGLDKKSFLSRANGIDNCDYPMNLMAIEGAFFGASHIHRHEQLMNLFPCAPSSCTGNCE